MAKKKYYVVKKGLSTGIFNTWAECEPNVKGISDAVYKSFTTEEEAKAFLAGEDIISTILEKADSENTLIIYVDGSYSDELKRYSYGILYIQPSGEIVEDSAWGNDEQALISRNVAGELLGVMTAIKWAKNNSFTKVILRYDYEGIEKWMSGEWKTKTLIAKQYIEYMKKNTEGMEIKFEKIAAHTNNKLNDRVDQLAKRALKGEKGTRRKNKQGDGYLSVKGILEDEIDSILEIIKEETGIEIKKMDKLDKVQYTISLEDSKFSIIYYKESVTTVLSGKTSSIQMLFITYLGELLDTEEITPVLNMYYEIDVKKEQIDCQVTKYLPNLPVDVDEKIKSTLLQAIYNFNISGTMPDYTFLLHPILRVTDAYLDIIMQKYHIEYEGNYNVFENKDGRGYKLKEEFKANVGAENKISHINRLYNFFYNQRHTLFHWDKKLGNIDTTRMIKTKMAADKINEEGLKLINEYYLVH